MLSYFLFPFLFLISAHHVKGDVVKTLLTLLENSTISLIVPSSSGSSVAVDIMPKTFQLSGPIYLFWHDHDDNVLLHLNLYNFVSL